MTPSPTDDELRSIIRAHQLTGNAWAMVYRTATELLALRAEKRANEWIAEPYTDAAGKVWHAPTPCAYAVEVTALRTRVEQLEAALKSIASVAGDIPDYWSDNRQCVTACGHFRRAREALAQLTESGACAAAAAKPSERRHGIYTYPDGTKWDSSTNVSTRPDGSTFQGEPDMRAPSERAAPVLPAISGKMCAFPNCDCASECDGFRAAAAAQRGGLVR
jgi:hypothetical protein